MWHTQEGLFKGKLISTPIKEIIEDNTSTPKIVLTVTPVGEPKDCA